MRGISCRLSPIPDHAFFEQAVLEGQVGHDLLQGGGLPTQVLHLVRRGSPRRVAGEPLLARLEEVLRPAIIHRRGDALAAAQLRDALLTPQALEHDADLLLGRGVGRWHAGGPSRPLPPAVSPARISASSSLLMATMNQKSSLP